MRLYRELGLFLTALAQWGFQIYSMLQKKEEKNIQQWGKNNVSCTTEKWSLQNLQGFAKMHLAE